MEVGDPLTIYDILWQYSSLEDSAKTISLARLVCYTDPVLFYSKHMLGVEPWITVEEMKVSFEMKRAAETKAGIMTEANMTDMYADRMARIPIALHLQQAFSWVNRTVIMQTGCSLANFRLLTPT